MRKFLIIAIIIAAATVIFSSAEANLISNSGFGKNFTDWKQWNPSNSSIYSWGRKGGKSVAGWWATSGWQDVPIANPNAPTKVGGWIYDDVAGLEPLTDGVYAVIRVEFKDAFGKVIGTWSTGKLTGADLTDNAWNEKTDTVTPSTYGPDVAKATLVWEVNNNGAGHGRGIFDDMVIEPIPELATPKPKKRSKNIWNTK